MDFYIILKMYLFKNKNHRVLWLHGLWKPRPHKCLASPPNCELSHALLWITCQHRLQRDCVDGILDFLSLRIKISSCLPVWVAPSWPTCWVWCEMCVPPLWPYYPPAMHTHALLPRWQHSLSSSVSFLIAPVFCLLLSPFVFRPLFFSSHL